MVLTPGAGQNILSRGLPKTGQRIEYSAGEDDGALERGWWVRKANITNRVRFLIKTLSGDDVVVDRATGLMWARDGNAAGCLFGAVSAWNGAQIYATGLNFAGFSDWSIPNIVELFSIVDFEIVQPVIWPPFTNTQPERYWSSTTRLSSTTRAYYVKFTTGIVGDYLKTTPLYLRCVRALHEI